MLDFLKNRKVRKCVVIGLWVLFDIITVNAAYVLALFVRFFVNNEFHPLAYKYWPGFMQFAPYYTGFCILVFAAFKLYNSMWKYANFSNLNQITAACAVTCAFQVIGTLLFVTRMPITYYVIGAVIQYALIVGSRFAYRFLIYEIKKFSGHMQKTENAIIIGAGDTAYQVAYQMSKAKNAAAKPVCMLTRHSDKIGSRIGGVPIFGTTDQLMSAIEKYSAANVVIADPMLPDTLRSEVISVCEGKNVKVLDVTGYFANMFGVHPLMPVLELIEGPVTLVIGDEQRTFESSEQAMASVNKRCEVQYIKNDHDRILVGLKEPSTESGSKEWAQQYKNETGQDVSFF